MGPCRRPACMGSDLASGMSRTGSPWGRCGRGLKIDIPC